MKRNYSYYFQKASNLLSFANEKKKGSYFLRAVYLLVSFVGKLFILTRPIFAVADNNYMAMVEHTHTFSFLKIFEGTTKKGKYLHLLGCYLIADIVAVILFFGISYPCIYLINHAPNATVFTKVLLNVLAYLPILLFLIFNVHLCPLGYLGSRTSGFNMSDYLYSAISGVKGCRGRLFFTSLLAGAFIFAAIGLPYILYKPIYSMFVNDVAVFIFIGIGIVMFLLYVALSGWFIKIKMANYLYFEDNIVSKKTVVVKQNPGTKVSYSPLFDDEADAGKENE